MDENYRGPGELIVMLRTETQPTLAHGRVKPETAFHDKTASELPRLGAHLVPLFGVSRDRLRAEATSLSQTSHGVPDLSRYYRVEGVGESPAEIAALLRDNETVEAAYWKPAAELPTMNDWLPRPEDAPPTTPDFSARQLYLDAAPGGIDARFAWTLPGGRGAGVGIIDIEGAWRFTHEDLLANQGGVIGGTESSDVGWRNHGTAVVGEFGGDINGVGVTGICPDATVRAVSIFGQGMGSSVAIRQAANALNAGDIILIELHRPGPRFNFAARADQGGYIAVEWWPDDFDAILFATQRGVIVVEAAGNGAENLDDAIYSQRPQGFPATWTNPFNRNNRDSGAVVVGAGAPPPGTHGNNHGPDRSRLGFSNWGALIDAQGWGREVTTVGYGDLQGGTNEDFWYTDRFSGTSSASPIVVGALGSLQGIVRARGMVPLGPARARACLRATGSPQQDEPTRPTTQRIGSRPNLREMVAWIQPKPKEVKEQDAKLPKELKDLKDRIKDRKDLKEKDLKEKDFKEKDFKEKDLKEKERKELKEVIKEKDLKDRKEKDKDIREVFPTHSATDHSLEQRVDGLERAMGELLHFIGPELRPDLTPGYGDANAEAEKQVDDAKGFKEREKPREW